MLDFNKIAKLFSILAAMVFLPGNALAGDMSSWDTEVEVEIDNSLNSNNLTDYQVLVSLNTQSIIAGGGMQDDGDDIRFTETRDDDTTLLDYWIESDTIDTSSTRIWVKVGSIPASSVKTIYLYYGNGVASSYEDPDNTFIEYITFKRNQVLSYGGPGQDQDPNDFKVADQGRTLRLQGNTWKAVSTSLTLNSDQALDYSFKSTDNQAEINGIGIDTQTQDISSNRFYKCYGTQNWGAYSSDPVYTGSDEYERLEMVLDDFTGAFSYIFLINDADAVSDTDVYYTDVRVRKYSSPEPEVSLDLPITQIDFTTTAQTIFQKSSSEIMTVQTQNETGSAQDADSDTTIDLSSSSGGGEFSLSADFSSTISSVIISSGSNSASFYYRDSSTGNPTITAAESPSQGWTDAQQSVTVQDLGLGIYKNEVLIDNSGCSSKTDYQVLFILNTQALISDGKMQSDGDDIRILDSDDATPLNFWIQTDTINSTSTRIWVKIPEIPAGEKTIYLYYGDASADSFSNPDGTFVEFMDFQNDGVISYGGTGQDIESNKYDIRDDGRTLRLYGNSWKASATELDLTSNDYKLDYSFKSTKNEPEINGIGLDTQTSSISAGRFYKCYGTQTWGSYAADPVYSGSGAYEDLGMVLDDFSNIFTYLFFTNDADSVNPTEVFYRDVRVRKYSSCEPGVAIVLPVSALNFTTAEQTVLEDRVSSVITVESQDELGSTQEVTSDTVINLGSTSGDGEFSLSSSPFNPVSSVTITSGFSSASFYYRDKQSGTQTITASEDPSQGWSDASQDINITQATVVGIYKRKITIDNSACSEKDNYQVRVGLDTQALISGGKMQPDGDDIRFLDADDITPLSYWIQTDTIDTSDTALWVKVPLIPSGTKDIYLYYGDQTAEALSSGDDTFIEFINFDDDGVVSYGGSSQDVESNKYQIQDDGYTLRIHGNSWKAVNTDLTLDGDKRLDFSFKSTQNEPEINGIGFDTETSGINANWFYKCYGTQNWGANPTVPAYSGSGSYEDLGMVLTDFTGTFSYLVLNNDIDASKNTNVFYRDVRVRKHDTCEPSLTVGEEESTITQLVFTTAPQSIVQNQSSTLMTVESQDAGGNARTVSTDTYVRFESDSLGGMFAPEDDPSGWEEDPEDIFIPEDESSVSFYYLDSEVGEPTITVSEYPSLGWTDAEQQETILPAANIFLVEVSTPQIVGTDFVLTITAMDDEGNVSTGYAGTVDITINYISPDTGSGVLSTTVTSAFVNGIATIQDQSFSDCGTVTITATDQSDPGMTGTSGNVEFFPFDFLVEASGLDAEISSDSGGTHTVSEPFILTVTARDPAGQACPNYKGDTGLSVDYISPSPDQSGALSMEDLGPEDWTDGISQILDLTYDKWGTITITATCEDLETREGTSGEISFSPEDFLVTLSDPPASRTYYYVGEEFSALISSRDYNREVVSNYGGTVAFTGIDLEFVEQEYTFVPDDEGSHRVEDITGIEETSTIMSVSDTVFPGVTGFSDEITLKEGNIQVLSTAGPVGAVSVQAKLFDSEGNVLSEDDSTTFTVGLNEFISDNDSAVSAATSTPAVVSEGVATITISDTESESVEVIPESDPELNPVPGVVRFGTVGGTGVGIEVWREKETTREE